ncbi:hypothetical protein [Emcibacter sp. SYSU 3D8]|uniref:hypothetical protein n=1 Tax=Emcibacter sp. SYSU 3D8 TaxID=3133969 RepID=UPI0031FE5B60
MRSIDFSPTGAYFATLSSRFQRIALDAVRQTAMLSWSDRLFFLSAAGDKHEVWRLAYDARYVGEQVPEWSRIVNAVIEIWKPAPIACFEMAAIYSLSEDPTWRMAGEAWCHANGFGAALADYRADPVTCAGELVKLALERLDRLAG